MITLGAASEEKRFHVVDILSLTASKFAILTTPRAANDINVVKISD